MSKESLKPIPTNINNSSPEKKEISDIPPIILGAGVFNYQYNDDPNSMPAEAILSRAFDLGIRAIDSSSYYGPSEIIVGNALNNIKDKYPRNSYMIFTKCGRVTESEFDYDPDHIEASVRRSLERFHTTYLDVVYLHDVEFMPLSASIAALTRLQQLKQQGLISYVGLSGYPVDYLLKVSSKFAQKFGSPLDLVLSYSNFCIQNTLLKDYVPKFFDSNVSNGGAGLKCLVAASPLSMGLIRSQPAPSFHPASKDLKDAIHKAAEYTKENGGGVDLADLAVRFALRNWWQVRKNSDSKTVLPFVYGLSSIKEVENAVKIYWQVQDLSNPENQKLYEQDQKLTQKVQEILGSHLNETWPSGINHDNDDDEE